MRDTGTMEAYRIPSCAFFLSSGRENLIDDWPFRDFCLCVSPQFPQVICSLSSNCLFFFSSFCDALIMFPPLLPTISYPCSWPAWASPKPVTFCWKHFNQRIMCFGWKLLTLRFTPGDPVPHSEWDCGHNSWEWQNSHWLQWCWFAVL